MKPTLLILAAGIGSRYGSLKQIDGLGPHGETIIDYSVYDAIQAGFGKVVFVIRRSIEQEFKESFAGKFSDQIEIDYVLQELDNIPAGMSVPDGRQKPWGTGHAVLVSADAIQEPFAMINADDYYGREAFQGMADYLRSLSIDAMEYSIMGYKLENTLSENGAVSRGICEKDTEGYLTAITERTKIYKAEAGIGFDEDAAFQVLAADTPVSMNMMGFTPTVFPLAQRYFAQFMAERGTELKSEFYIPSILAQAITEDTAKVKVLSSDANWFGVTYKDDRPVVVSKLAQLTSEGIYPAPLWAVEKA